MERQHDWGPGRVDTFNPYKAIQFNFPMDKLPHEELIGPADYPSIFNQGPRQGMQLHWDGNNPSVEERNKSAALGAGVTPVTIDLKSLDRIVGWLWNLKAPEYQGKSIRKKQKRANNFTHITVLIVMVGKMAINSILILNSLRDWERLNLSL